MQKYRKLMVVTNPTHFSVALKYSKVMVCTTCRCEGYGCCNAAKIRELAQEHNVPILRGAAIGACAKAKHTKSATKIPEALYAAVAEILAYVFQLRSYKKHGGTRPNRTDEDVDVPKDRSL